MIMHIHPAITLKEKIIQKLMFEPAVDGSKIDVSCKEGVATLIGSVGSFFEKKVAERAVRSIVGVKAVENKLQINLAAKHQYTDSEITNAANDALKWDVAVPEDTIHISVKEGHLTLTGEVDWWYQKENAEKAIRNIKGVKDINNQISIRSAITVKNVRNKIMEEFHRNASIDAEKINIEIDGNKVVLKGSVRSWPEMKEATRAAWAVSGVTQVDNRLIINS